MAKRIGKRRSSVGPQLLVKRMQNRKSKAMAVGGNAPACLSSTLSSVSMTMTPFDKWMCTVLGESLSDLKKAELVAR